MTIEGAVDLVVYAFENGKSGDIFVQKAPAATIETLALAIKKLFKATNPIQIIGTRHGEKLYETLVSREEMARAEDLGNYFRIPMDSRDLNYTIYFSAGEPKISSIEEYNSHNTVRLDVDEMCEMLLKLDIVKRALNGEKIEN